MKTLHTIPVPLGKRRYDVLIGTDHLGSLGGRLRKMGLGTHAVVVSNPTVQRKHGASIRATLARGGFPPRLLTVPDSEKSKSMAVLGRLLDGLADLDGPGKRIFLVLAGGGVVGDLGGVAAGLYRRGVPYVQLPTTLLAQVDSSLGGKTAVDLPHGKNLVGLIVQPRLVFIEIAFLRTLPDRQIRSGLSEALKCGVIRDRALFERLEGETLARLRSDEPGLAWVVSRAVKVKADVVARDETEFKGLRAILNFGHTFGHALETATGYTRVYTHGEAVAVGMAVATDISLRLGMISPVSAERIRSAIVRLGLPVRARGAKPAALHRAMAHDKKWFSGRNRWVLPTGVGRCVVRSGVPEAAVRAAIQRALEG